MNPDDRERSEPATRGPESPFPAPAPPPWVRQQPLVESPFFESMAVGRDLSSDHLERARKLHENGFLVIEDAFGDELVARVEAEVAPLLESTEPDPRRHPGRFHDAWQESPAVRAMAADERVLALLEALYGRAPIPFQTLNFRVGTQQRAHADSIHFSSFPRRFLCGVWVALEDVGERNGGLVYYPGSHRLPEVDYNDLGLRYINPQLDPRRQGGLDELTYADHERYEDFVEELMAAHGLEKKVLEAPRGTALLWASGLVHGGGPIREPGSTRWSQVTHYYFEDCVYFAPICSNPVTGDLHLKRVVDVRTGELVPHRYYGMELPPIEADGLYKLYLDRDGSGEEAVRLISNYEIKHLADDIRYLRGVEEENANLRQMKDNLEAALATVQGSPSYRLGRALTAPLRWFRRR